MLKTELQPPLISARALARDERGRILMVQRDGSGELKDAWEIPGGKPKHLESIRDAAVRELEEEAGYTVSLPPSALVELPARTIPDGKNMGRTIIAVAAVVEVLPASDQTTVRPETRQARWIEPSAIGSLMLAPTTRDVLDALL